MQPSARCCDDRVCPKLLLAPTDVGTRGYSDAAITGIRALFH